MGDAVQRLGSFAAVGTLAFLVDISVYNILAAVSALGLTVSAAGPAAAGLFMNHAEPLTGR